MGKLLFAIGLMGVTLPLWAAVFGDDNRINLEESAHRQLSLSIMAMVPNKNLTVQEDSITASYQSERTHLGAPFCDDVKFISQPSAADCTGFYLGNGLMMTAGHCVSDQYGEVRNSVTKKCAEHSWLLNFHAQNISPDGSVGFHTADRFTCQEVVSASYNAKIDYAIIRISGALDSLTALTLNPQQNLERGLKVSMAGFPAGLPAKYTDQATVFYSSAGQSFFKTDLDAFFGNSGSPVFNEQQEVIGILVSGEIDYTLDQERGCARINKCNGVGRLCDVFSGQYGALGSVVTKISSALEHAGIASH